MMLQTDYDRHRLRDSRTSRLLSARLAQLADYEFHVTGRFLEQRPFAADESPCNVRDFSQRETNDGVNDGATYDSEASEELEEEDESSASGSEPAPPRGSGRGRGRGRGAAPRQAQVVNSLTMPQICHGHAPSSGWRQHAVTVTSSTTHLWFMLSPASPLNSTASTLRRDSKEQLPE
ncbi:hypothetical protein ABBQ38_000123 [Trebouxia sp. C0009 RCD-2024]